MLDSGHDNTGVIILVSKNVDVPTLQVSGTREHLRAVAGARRLLRRLVADEWSLLHSRYNGRYTGISREPQVRQVELSGGQCSPADSPPRTSSSTEAAVPPCTPSSISALPGTVTRGGLGSALRR